MGFFGGGGSGGTPGGSGTELQYKNGSSFGAMSGTSWDNTNRSLTITGATVTTSKPVFDLSQTWNAGGVTFTGLKFNVTNTASASGSLLLDLQVGGVSQFSVSSAGVISTVNGTLLSGMTDTWNNAGTVYSSIQMNVTNTASAALSRLFDLQIGGVPLFQIRKDNSFALFNAYTSDANFESGGSFWSSNVFKIGTQKGGSGGTARDTYIVTPSRQWTFNDASGAFNSPSAITSNYQGAAIGWASTGGFDTFPGDGIIRMFNSAQSSFGRLIWGLQTTAFAAIARDGAGLKVVLGDNTAGAFIKTAAVTVASLPSAATAGAGARMTVTDASAPSYGATVSGGGAVLTNVTSDGTNWKCQ
jgi:hypothetical protein